LVTNRKYIPVIPVLLGVILCFSPLSESSTEAGNLSEDINELSQRAKLINDTFMQESFAMRMGYEYYGRFPDKNDKSEFYSLCEKAGSQLSEVIQIQETLKKRIELYKGQDWEDKYGSTGLWRKLFTDLQISRLIKCRIDFNLAKVCEQTEKEKILRRIAAQINSADSAVFSPDLLLLKAKTTAELSQIDLAYKPSAISQFDCLSMNPEIPKGTYFRAQLEKIKLTGQSQPRQLDTLAKELAQSDCANDLELVLSFAFFRRRLNHPHPFKWAVRTCPQSRSLLSSLVLDDINLCIEKKQNIEHFSIYEAQLAAQAVWRAGAEDYSLLLEKLSDTEKFQTPFILYSAAYKSVENRPAKAVELLIKATCLQQQQKCQLLGLEPVIIARQAAQLAYNLFAEEQPDCRLALTAFDNYCKLAGENADPELEYIYSAVLLQCGRKDECRKLLGKIAGKKSGIRQKRAKFDLIALAIEQEDVPLPNQINEFTKQLKDLIGSCDVQNQAEKLLKTQALTLYCRLLAESEDELAAQKILTVLDETEVGNNPELTILKSNALHQLGALDEAVKYLLSVVDTNSCRWTDQAAVFLAEVTEQIEQVQSEYSYSADFLDNCKELAQLYYNCLENSQAGLYLAEITIFTADDDSEILAAEKLLNNISKKLMPDNIELLRCRARLLSKKDRFEQAARLWAKISDLRKNHEPSANEQSRQWWRAKFYEVFCWSRLPQTQSHKVLHTIEILENSFRNIPALWAEKLRLLKRSCQNQPTRSDKIG